MPQPRIDYIKSVLAEEDAMIRVIWTLAVLAQDRSRKEYAPDQPEFERLNQHARRLCEALDLRAGSGPSSF